MSADLPEPHRPDPLAPGPQRPGTRRWPVPRWVLLANLGAQIGIVLTGGLVRLTGSGLGCPTWPQCVPGSYTPVPQQAEGYHSQVEYANRLLTFVVGVAALAALVVVVRAVRAGRLPRRLLWLGSLPLVGVFAQAGLGGVTVLTGLTPITVAAHFLLSMVLVAGSTLLLLRVGQEGRMPPAAGAPAVVWVPRRELTAIGRLILLVGAVVLMLGTVVTGSGPHSGDEQTPRFDLDPRMVSWLHADAVLLFLGLVVVLLVGLRLVGAPAEPRRRAGWLLAVTLAQGGVGYLQYFTGLPILLVAGHMLGAALLVVAMVAAADAVAAFGRRPPAGHQGAPASRSLTEPAPAP